jgi:hypothetical protein
MVLALSTRKVGLYGVITFFEIDLLGRTQWTGSLGIPWDDQDVSTNTTLVSGFAEREKVVLESSCLEFR